MREGMANNSTAEILLLVEGFPLYQLNIVGDDQGLLTETTETNVIDDCQPNISVQQHTHRNNQSF